MKKIWLIMALTLLLSIPQKAQDTLKYFTFKLITVHSSSDPGLSTFGGLYRVNVNSVSIYNAITSIDPVVKDGISVIPINDIRYITVHETRNNMKGLAYGFLLGLAAGLIIDWHSGPSWNSFMNMSIFDIPTLSIWQFPVVPEIILGGIGCVAWAVIGTRIPITFTINGDMDQFKRKRRQLARYAASF